MEYRHVASVRHPPPHPPTHINISCARARADNQAKIPAAAARCFDIGFSVWDGMGGGGVYIIYICLICLGDCFSYTYLLIIIIIIIIFYQTNKQRRPDLDERITRNVIGMAAAAAAPYKTLFRPTTRTEVASVISKARHDDDDCDEMR